MNLTIHLTQQSRADMTVEVHLLTNMVTHTTTSLNNGGLKFFVKKKTIITNLRHFHVQLLQYPLYLHGSSAMDRLQADHSHIYVAC